MQTHCVAAAGSLPADPELLDELLRAYVTLLSAHFQGVLTDLYTEASLKVVARIKQAGIRLIAQAQFAAGLKLDKVNPTLDRPVRGLRHASASPTCERPSGLPRRPTHTRGG